MSGLLNLIFPAALVLIAVAVSIPFLKVMKNSSSAKEHPFSQRKELKPASGATQVAEEQSAGGGADTRGDEFYARVAKARAVFKGFYFPGLYNGFDRLEKAYRDTKGSSLDSDEIAKSVFFANKTLAEFEKLNIGEPSDLQKMSSEISQLVDLTAKIAGALEDGAKEASASETSQRRANIVAIERAFSAHGQGDKG